MQTLAILGSTGSIGTQALDVVRRNPGRYRVACLTVNGNLDALAGQIAEFEPDTVVVCDPSAAAVARKLYAGHTQVLEGPEALCQVASRPDVHTVVAALVGFAGLAPTISALRAGKRVALANKETMVVAGQLMNRLAAEHGAEIIPVDSEHSAVFQCLAGEDPRQIETIILTASGGPFRELPPEKFAGITVESTLKHPNWNMGPKITVDSATLMNKGLELIEARWLFNTPPHKLSVVVHPQSIIHSMVQFIDGSVKAQMGLPDMRLPIQYALAYPQRIYSGLQRTHFPSLASLTFHEPDTARFPCLRLATQAMERGGTATTVLNAANEVAVAGFLAGEIPFTGIPRLIERALESARITDDPTLDDIIRTDQQTREEIGSYLRKTYAA